MKSRTSFFNYATFKKNVTRFWPIWGAYLFCLVLAAPLTFLICKSVGVHALKYYARDIEDAAIVLMPTVAMFMSGLSVMAVFSYLFKSNRVDFTHSLPIKRSSLFVTNYISGFCFSLVPNLIISAVMIVLMGLNGVNCAVIFKIFVAITLMTVFYYGLAVFCAMICGNAVAMPMVYLAINFLAVGINGIVSLLGSMFLKGYEAALIPASRILTPIVNMYIFDEHDINMVYLSKMSAYAIVGIVLTICAYLLYRIKKSESAGDIASFKPIRYVFRYLLGGIGAYTVGLLLFYIFENIFLTQRKSMGGFILFMLTTLFGALLLYYVFEMFALKKFKVFKGSLKGVLPLVIAVILISLFTFFDLFGYSTRIPDISDVESVRVNIDYSQRLESDDVDFIKLVRRTHTLIASSETEEYGESFEVEYRLESGNLLKRRYRYYRDDELISGAIVDLLEAPATNNAVADMLEESEIHDFNIYRDGDYIDVNSYANGDALAKALINDIRGGAKLKFETGYETYYYEEYKNFYKIHVYSHDYNQSVHCLVDESFTETWAYLQTLERIAKGLDAPVVVYHTEPLTSI
ncbi:MAG: hypothetical protein II982_03705 [Clostridia bacterium]|nr:hypothetical protein [Clostridia bacterium]